ncbi:hypothetical protein DFQ14_104174 [Halopolyspora algeriensis]|uniref:DUF1214 domain-containing protein n=1 Tax=Halopolyspora algeriensis TaxID=1500506 RepID=A0A368VSC5_9ACTN|nr:hypothetical protein [Halopolyspora algeriensis]RCW44585.1 hypothetical protein DFQ14_104174 [Halopolyspora algeriensis]TQM55945.1 hypothetical protein FHU43_0723 [Halopolyspora algeriensis]
MLTQSFADAIVQAEKIIAEAPHVESEQDLLEGYDYLAGSIRAALQSAWAYERDFPRFIRSATPATKVGLDNPDTLYFSARIRPDAEYLVTGTRGSTADLSFQVLDGDYSPADVPGSLSAFDDRDITIGADGTFELRFQPSAASGEAGTAAAGPDHFTLGSGAAMLLVREVYSDWNTERPGTIRIQRADRIGTSPPAPDGDLPAKRYSAAGKILLSQLKTFLAFPEWYYLNLPVNTLTEPRSTPGGLSTQFSSVGHYDLAEQEAMVVTVPASEAPYQGIQLGSMWYVSMDFINHQTSLNTDQARIDPDGRIRFVIGERDPGLANWLECTGHRRGYVQLRWQRLARALTPADGPEVEIVDMDELPHRLPYYERARVTPQERRNRIAARQAAVADRMLG